MDLRALREEVALAIRLMYERGLISALTGNASAKVGDDLMLITPSGVHKGLMKPEDVLLIDFSGRVLWGMGRPSREWRMHRAVYQASDARSVVHSHSPFTLVLSPESLRGPGEVVGGIVKVGYAPPGSAELAELVYRAVSRRRSSVYLLEGHGVLALGNSPLEAEALIEYVEELCRVELLRRLV